jgi:nucleoside-diphosphate-sugar epimerase
MKKVLITGSGGLIGSECVRMLAKNGWNVVGVDNDMRQQFFGAAGTTRQVVRDLIDSVPHYRHTGLIRDRQACTTCSKPSDRIHHPHRRAASTTKLHRFLTMISMSTPWAP